MACLFNKIFRLVLITAWLVVSFASPVVAGDGFSFSWQPNPATDEVVGYRLYYGSSSRSVTGGYDYYIELNSGQRCPAGGNGFGCEPLPAGALSCQNLFRDNPTCTVYNLPGHVYLAMTACNAWSESAYTHEVAFPPRPLVLSQVYKLLLD